MDVRTEGRKYVYYIIYIIILHTYIEKLLAIFWPDGGLMAMDKTERVVFESRRLAQVSDLLQAALDLVIDFAAESEESNAAIDAIEAVIDATKTLSAKAAG